MNNNPTIPPDGTPEAIREQVRRAIATGGDDLNPELLFATTHTALLQAIEIGLIDPVHLAHGELVRRGLGTPAADSTEPGAYTAAQQAVAEIARRVLHLDDLETHNSDGLDFHELSVWAIHDALIEAHAAGVQAGRAAVCSK